MKRLSLIVFFSISILLVTAGEINFYEQYNLKPEIINKIIKQYSPEFFVYIKKRDFKLFVIDGKGRIIKIYNIAIGKKKNFERKIYRDDNGTPEGLYFVTEILSESAPTNTQSYKKLKKMNSVYFKASEGHHLWGHPDKDLGRNAYGPRFFRINYPNKEDIELYEKLKKQGKIPKDKNGNYVGLGSGIGIHGTNDPPSIGHRISAGCIRMFNSEVIQLDNFLKLGTPVYIEQ